MSPAARQVPAVLGSEAKVLGQPVPDDRPFSPWGGVCTCDLHEVLVNVLAQCYRPRWCSTQMRWMAVTNFSSGIKLQRELCSFALVPLDKSLGLFFDSVSLHAK